MPERFRIVGTSRAPSTDDGFRALRPRGGRRFGGVSPNGELGAVRAQALASSDADEEAPRSRRPSTSPSASSAATPRLLHYLSVPPRRRAGDRRDARRSRPRRGRADDHREALRHRPRLGPALNERSTRSSTRRRSSASTTSSARRRCRTCWRCASPTACSSRSGTATTSTTSRSTCPRRSRSGCAAASTRRPAPSATWSSRTSSRCSASSRWSRRRRSAEGAARRDGEGLRGDGAAAPEDVVRGQYDGYRDEDGRRAATPTPRPSSR